jgi:F-type H+-transporting ATPase subunit a
VYKLVHFNWTQLIPGVTHEYIHVATGALVTILIVLMSIVARLALGNGEMAVTPAGKVSIKGIFEVVVEFVVGLVNMVIGEHGKKYIPMFGAIFLYIFLNNLMGLVPGMTPATDNLNTTVAIGAFTFLTYNFLGVKENGLAYFKHFLGPVLWLAPLMLPIELISHSVRPLSLGLRLAGNMTGDHTALSIFLDLAPYGVPVIFYALGTFVCFIQAFVFTLLSMVYVSMATAHDH